MNEDHRSEETSVLVIPEFNGTPRLSLDITKTREAEGRFYEIKTVNPSTYTDLEHSFGESYRELRRHYATIGHEIAKCEKALRLAKAAVMLETYPEFMKDKPKSHDNADMRDSYLVRDPDYSVALDRLNMLKAMECFVDGRIKGLENASRYMKKAMDLIIRGGLSSADLYVNHGRR